MMEIKCPKCQSDKYIKWEFDKASDLSYMRMRCECKTCSTEYEVYYYPHDIEVFDA